MTFCNRATLLTMSGPVPIAVACDKEEGHGDDHRDGFSGLRWSDGDLRGWRVDLHVEPLPPQALGGVL